MAENTSSLPVAVILAGSGVYDGSEITEAVSCLVALGETPYMCYAPNLDQMHAVDHTKGKPHAQNRNALQESARIARGSVLPLSELKVAECSALLCPGGFGVAKNLCNWAVEDDKSKVTVNSQIARIITEFHAAKKPMGFCCIAPVLPALVLSRDNKVANVQLTVGCASSTSDEGSWPYAGTAGGMESIGAKHVETKQVEACHDKENNVYTCSAYMFDGKPYQIAASVNGMVSLMLKNMKN